MGMMKRFYEADKISIMYYSNGHIKKATFMNCNNGLYSTEYETQDGRGNVLERYDDGSRPLQSVERSCNGICDNHEVIRITIE